MRALRLGSAEAVVREIGSLPQGSYNGFNLLCAGQGAASLVAHGKGGFSRRLSPGLHIVTNHGLNLPEDPKARRIRELIGDPAALTTVDHARDRLDEVLRDHAGADILERVCIHSGIYGTRSSTLLALHGEEPGRSLYLHTEGAPCETPWKDVSDLFSSAPAARAGGVE